MESKGPVPYERFSEVNSKYDRVRWAEEFDNPDTVRQSVALARWIDENPRGFREYLDSQMRAMGLLEAPQPTQPQQSTRASGPPQPDYIDPNTGLKVYSAERAQELVNWAVSDIQSKVDQRLAPLENKIGTAEVNQAARLQAQAILTDARQNWDGFKEHEAQILKEMGKDRRLSVEGAYRRVVLPVLKDRHRQELLKELEQKPGANTVSPASAQPSGQRDTTKMTLRDLFRAEMRRRGLGT